MEIKNNEYDVIVVGAGIAGLIATAYLTKYHYHPLLLEQSNQIGGLVHSFTNQGFTFDTGIRAFENSGIIFPMLKQLGIKIDFVKSPACLKIGNEFVYFNSKDSLNDYQKLLEKHFPNEINNISQIIEEIKKIMKYMEVIYGIDNPLFLDSFKDKEYVFKTLIPWLIKYQKNIKKAMKLSEPVNDFLRRFTQNQALIDIISQHFFQNTPTFFALSYFGLYPDYSYPIGGTEVLPQKIAEFIENNQGEIKTNSQVVRIDVDKKQVILENNEIFGYKKLIWACDLNTLYRIIEFDKNKSLRLVIKQRKLLHQNKGGDSIFSLFLETNFDKSYFEKCSGAHCFYTPTIEGITKFGKPNNCSLKQEKIKWVESYLKNTTYEISIPSLRDPNLAPPNKTGVIISTLMDYSFVKKIFDEGWYEEFKYLCKEIIINILSSTIFPELEDKILLYQSSTPLTIARITKNSDGAITGWAFSNNKLPSESRMPKIARSILTPIPHVFQAGQWSFSPSGVPISILTGKLAADKIKKQLK
ncbi:MAG: phytoene desaturase family protein [Bacilli bacterium]